jgi:thiol-disulfide isomerase/thioredoxin
MKKYKIIPIGVMLVFFNLALFIICKSQDKVTKLEYPEVDKTCPEFFLNDISNYSKTKARLKDFEGKWLILDFWGRYCSNCIKSMPKMDSIQRQFKSNLQIVFIGSSIIDMRTPNYNDKSVYAKLKEKHNYSFAVAFDSILFNKFGIHGLPYILIIDPKGNVKGITTSISKKNIEQFISGQSPKLTNHSSSMTSIENTIDFDPRNPFLIHENGGTDTDFLFRSILTKWNPSMRSDYPGFHNNNKWGHEGLLGPRLNDGIQILGLSLIGLYNTAYLGDRLIRPFQDSLYGEFWPKPVLELKDKSKFSINKITGTGIYCYSLINKLGNVSDAFLQKKMQRDLEDYFNYEVKVENRLMPCFIVTSSKDAKAKLKTKNSEIPSDFYSDLIKNVSIKALLRMVAINASNPIESSSSFPFFDETDIIDNIDVYAPINLRTGNNLNELIGVLKKQGIYITQSEKEMQVIVICDPNTEASSGKVLQTN